MDREKYGKIIVDQIINDYKSSKEFSDDARRFVYRWLNIILNYKIAGLGDNLVRNLEGKNEVTEEEKNKFLVGMAEYDSLKENMDKLFDLMDTDEADSVRPIPIINKNK